MDPSMRLFEFDENSLLASIPTMYAFPKVCLCFYHPVIRELTIFDAVHSSEIHIRLGKGALPLPATLHSS